MLNNITPARAGHVVPENDEGGRATDRPLRAKDNERLDSAVLLPVKQDHTAAHKHFARPPLKLAAASPCTKMSASVTSGYSLVSMACTCGTSPTAICLTCARFLKYKREVELRRAEWARWGAR